MSRAHAARRKRRFPRALPGQTHTDLYPAYAAGSEPVRAAVGQVRLAGPQPPKGPRKKSGAIAAESAVTPGNAQPNCHIDGHRAAELDRPRDALEVLEPGRNGGAHQERKTAGALGR